MGSEKFCLRWNDFENNISQAFKELRDDKDFFDVTLACDDEQIQAHKVILSACSPFFRNILRRNPHQHPLLYLKGVKYNDLQSVLNFMYHGEVNVAQEELNSFLAVAEELRVKGLTQNNQQNIIPKQKQTYSSPKSPPIQKTRPPDREPIPLPKRPKPASIQAYTADDDEIQEVVPVKSEPHETANSSAVNVYQHHQSSPIQPASHVTHVTHPLAPAQTQLVQDESLHYAGDESYDDYGGYEGDQGYEGAGGVVDQNLAAAEGNKGLSLEELTEKYLERTPGQTHSFACLICGKPFHDKTSGKFHLEAKHFPSEGYYCNICGKHLKTQNSLKCHLYQTHTKEQRDAAKR